MKKTKQILITGCAGFIGFHLARRLLEEGETIVGLDNLNNYYDVQLKADRLILLRNYKNFTFTKASLEDTKLLVELFEAYPFERVIHLAAQAGVRYSLQNPHAYIEANLTGFLNILEGCRRTAVRHLIYASSSSVYGANTKMPFSRHHNVDHPVSLYAATKKANELMAHTYSHLYGLPATGLRFFTVYGPWGRPDMALFIFTRAILEGKPIKIFNYGQMKRDFTYVDDIVEGITRLIDRIPAPNPSWSGDAPDPGSSYAPYRIYNIGHNKPEELLHFIAVLEKELGKRATKEYLPLQPGDVVETCADIDDLYQDTGFKPVTPIEEGIAEFVTWYRSYYGI
ncbi:MAG: NAD-dependent epimerase [Dethiobacter sp.]|jgi:UDP-glucuronate 4-epimerase|nr:NAD-dependent epimerase [Dethiobacter sp.]